MLFYLSLGLYDAATSTRMPTVCPFAVAVAVAAPLLRRPRRRPRQRLQEPLQQPLKPQAVVGAAREGRGGGGSALNRRFCAAALKEAREAYHSITVVLHADTQVANKKQGMKVSLNKESYLVPQIF